MLRKKSIVIFIVSIILTSCEVKTNKEMIDLASINLLKYEDDLNKIIQWIDNNKTECMQFIEIAYPQKNAIQIYCDTTKSILENNEFSSFLLKFYKDFGIYRIQIFENGISFTSNVRNQSLDSYSYIYFRKLPVGDNYFDYKVFTNGGIPKEVSGWLYNLKGNWYLESLPEYPDTIKSK